MTYIYEVEEINYVPVHTDRKTTLFANYGNAVEFFNSLIKEYDTTKCTLDINYFNYYDDDTWSEYTIKINKRELN